MAGRAPCSTGGHRKSSPRSRGRHRQRSQGGHRTTATSCSSCSPANASTAKTLQWISVSVRLFRIGLDDTDAGTWTFTMNGASRSKWRASRDRSWRSPAGRHALDYGIEVGAVFGPTVLADGSPDLGSRRCGRQPDHRPRRQRLRRELQRRQPRRLRRPRHLHRTRDPVRGARCARRGRLLGDPVVGERQQGRRRPGLPRRPTGRRLIAPTPPRSRGLPPRGPADSGGIARHAPPALGPHDVSRAGCACTRCALDDASAG
jgi:hypothetical protein